VVCISHSRGAGGEEVGRLVAARLGFLYVDEEIVSRVASRAGIDPAAVADEERRKPVVTRMLEALAQGSAEAWALAGPPAQGGHELSGEDLRALIRETIEQTAARGNVVIVAHAASRAVSHLPEVIRVLVTASPETRAARIGGAGALDQAQAVRVMRDSDRGRRDYLKRFYDVDEELPTHYDLVVNTDVLSAEQAAQLVLQAAS
jgi:Cytidylate kinase-like family